MSPHSTLGARQSAVVGARSRSAILLTVLVALVFVPHLRGDFVWDDTRLVEHNPDVTTFGGIWHLLVSPIEPGATVYRPFSSATFWLQSVLAGMSLPWLRAGNIVLHLGCVLLLHHWLLRRAVNPIAALIAAGVFSVHPTVTEAVMWLNGRHDTLGALCALAAMNLRTRVPSRPRVLGVAGLTLLAMLCKEVFCVLPAVYALDEGLSARGTGSRPGPLAVTEILVSAVSIASVFALRHALGIPGVGAIFRTPPTLLARCALGVLRHDLLQILTLSQGPTIESFHLPRVGRAVATAIVLVVVVLSLTRGVHRGSARAGLALLGLGWSVLYLLPAAVAIVVTGLYANRYVYLPCMGMAMALAAAVDGVCARTSTRSLRTFGGAAAVLCVALAIKTSRAAADWRDEATLFASAVRRAPRDGRALYHLAVTVQRRAGCETALPMFVRATELTPGYVRAWHNVTGCLLQLGRYTEALAPAQRAERLDPRDARNAYNLGMALVLSHHPEDAHRWFVRALAIDPGYAPARDALGAR